MRALPWRVFGQSATGQVSDSYAQVPPVDVYETAECYFVYMDLPGVRKEDIDVSYTHGTLTLNAEPKWVGRDDGHWIQHERRTGPFVRSIALGMNVNPDSIQASYQDGILALQVAKPSSQVEEAVSILVS